MKKSYLILAVATSLLVSCAQSEKLNNDLRVNDVPRVIGFNTYSEKAVKGVTEVETLQKYHKTFAVWATKKSNNDENAAAEYVFNGDSIKDIITYNDQKMAPNFWNYSPERYWDRQATYDFVAVAPNANIIRYNNPGNVADNAGTFVTKDSAGYTLIGQNLQSYTEPSTSEIRVGFNGGKNQDTDLMTTVKKITRNGATGDMSDVSLEFKHILAKLNIAIAKDQKYDNVKVLIDTVEITGLHDRGTYHEGIATTESSWHSEISSDTANYHLYWANTNGIELLKGEGEGESYQPGKFLYFIESLVMPQNIIKNVQKLTIKYAIVSGTAATGTHKEYYNYVLYFDDGKTKVFENFMERNNYTIFLTVKPNVITFDAQATGWNDKNNNQNIVPPVQP